MWSIWHHVVAINKWHAKILVNFFAYYPYYPSWTIASNLSIFGDGLCKFFLALPVLDNSCFMSLYGIMICLDRTSGRNLNLGMEFGTSPGECFMEYLDWTQWEYRQPRVVAWAQGSEPHLRKLCYIWQNGLEKDPHMYWEIPPTKASVIEEFDSSWGARGILCRCHGFVVSWNLKAMVTSPSWDM